MGYRFTANQSLPEQFANIVADEVKGASVALSTTDPAKQPEAVHTARKTIKKLRALLRLVASQVDPRVFKEENRNLRQTGRLLAELRDAEAILETFNSAAEASGFKSRSVELLRTELRKQNEHLLTPARLKETMHSAHLSLTEVLTRLNQLQLPPGGLNLIYEGLDHFYRLGRKALRRARDSREVSDVHDFRKRVKDHWYHARLLSGVDGQFWEARVAQFKKLEGLLGEAHNLAVLEDRLSSIDLKQAKAFRHQLRDTRDHLETEALRLGKELYREKHLHWTFQPHPVAA